MPDVYLASRLQGLARHEFNACFSGQTQRGRETSPVAAVILAQAAYHALLGFAALSLPIDGDLDGEKQSLIVVARTLVQEGVRSFQPWEMDRIASLDIIHMRPVTSVLLPDEIPRDIFTSSHSFVDQLTNDLYRLVEAAGANRT